ncbi:MAG: DUF4445 domain-containing protein, partial [Planctomycetes bacterium]|nr:DUF4445 domain-containing protein [Planctomycetota bacterium]
LAKGAITAGLRLLLERRGAGLADLDTVWLAGAFGNCVDRDSARRIGLLPVPGERVRPVGNAALLGAKIALFALPQCGAEFAGLRARVEHVALDQDPRFQQVFVDELGFPAP